MNKATRIALAVLAGAAVAVSAIVGLGTLEPEQTPEPIEMSAAVVWTGEFHCWDRETWAEVSKIRNRWSRGLRRTADRALRMQTIREIESAVLGSDSLPLLAGLLTIRDPRGPELDRMRLRDRVVSLLDSEAAAIRCYAILALEPVHADGPKVRAKVLALADDSDQNVRRMALHALVRLSGGKLDQDAVELMKRHLLDGDELAVRDTLSALESCRDLPDALVALLVTRRIELTRSRSVEHWREAIAGLGGIGHEKAVDRLLEILRDSQYEKRRSAFMALRGLPESQMERSSGLLLDLLEEEDEPVVWSFCLDLLAEQGAERHVERIEAWAEDDLLTVTQRGWAADAVETIRIRTR